MKGLIMKKILCILTLSVLCLTGCEKSNISNISNISSAMVFGDQEDNFYEKTFGKPDVMEKRKLIWNKYNLVDDFYGELSVKTNDYEQDSKLSTYEWDWMCVGTEEDYFEIYKSFASKYGQAIPIRDDNTRCVFQIEEKPREGSEYARGAELRYDADTNTINFMWDYPIFLDETEG